jgi:CBS domain-containing membrane protein
MYTANDLMTRSLIVLSENDLLDEAGDFMDLGHVRHLPVTRHRKLAGLVTHRDLLRQCRKKDLQLSDPRRVSDIMKRDVMSVRPETPVREIIELMLTTKFGCVPVIDATGTLVEIITEHDLLRVARDYVDLTDRRDLAAEYEADA